MSAFAGSAVTALVGLAAIAVTLNGTFSNYVKVGLRWPLIISGLVLVIVGSVSLVLSMRRSAATASHHGPGIGALFVVFVAALALAPPPLGAASAADRVPNRVSLTEAPDPIEWGLPPLETIAEAPTEGAADPLTSTTIVTTEDRAEVEPEVEEVSVESQEASPAGAGDQATASEEPDSALYSISLYDFVGYAFFDPDEIIGIPFELVGFAATEPDIDGGFRLTRYLMECCASDAFPLQVTLADPPFVPADDQWVVAEAVWYGELTDVDEYGDGVPVLEVLDLRPIDPPANPYET